MKIRVSIMGRSYHMTDGLHEFIELDDPATLEEAVQRINQLMPEGQTLTGSCLVLLGGTHFGSLDNHDPISLSDGDELTLIAPVAGG